MSAVHAELRCDSCGATTEHQLRYAGRLLESTRCTVCGAQVEVSARRKLPAYAADLEQRVLSKPRRMLRRAARDPLGFAVALPGAVLRQPSKFARELWELVRR